MKLKPITFLTQKFEDIKYYFRPDGRRVKTVEKTTVHYHAVLHNPKGPAVVKDNGEKRWYIMGKLHREDGPAVINSNGQYWFQNDVYHRDGFPAIIWNNGRRCWYQHGKLHRTDGPAIEDPKKGNEWWENGMFIRKEE